MRESIIPRLKGKTIIIKSLDSLLVDGLDFTYLREVHDLQAVQKAAAEERERQFIEGQARRDRAFRWIVWTQLIFWLGLISVVYGWAYYW